MGLEAAYRPARQTRNVGPEMPATPCWICRKPSPYVVSPKGPQPAHPSCREALEVARSLTPAQAAELALLVERGHGDTPTDLPPRLWDLHEEKGQCWIEPVPFAGHVLQLVQRPPRPPSVR